MTHFVFSKWIVLAITASFSVAFNAAFAQSSNKPSTTPQGAASQSAAPAPTASPSPVATPTPVPSPAASPAPPEEIIGTPPESDPVIQTTTVPHAAQIGKAELLKKPSQIQNLTVEPYTSPVTEKRFKTKSGKIYRTFSLLAKGRFVRPDWVLLEGEKTQSVSPDGLFQTPIGVEQDETQVHLLAVGPKGDVEKQTLQITLDQWNLLAGNAPTRRWSLFASPQFSLILFNDARYTAGATLTSLTVKAGGSFYILPNRWDVAGSVYFNVLPITSTIAGTAIRFLGLNIRSGFQFPWLKSPWKLSLYGGWYYLTMMVSSNDRGFSGMNGPQLYPQLERTLPNKGRISAYIKYSPMFNGFSVMSLSNFEFATGATYLHPIKDPHLLTFGVDFSTSRLTISGVLITTTNVSFGVGYAI